MMNLRKGIRIKKTKVMMEIRIKTQTIHETLKIAIKNDNELRTKTEMRVIMRIR